MIRTKEVPHFCFLEEVELPDEYLFEDMRARALHSADSAPDIRVRGNIEENNWVRAYWHSINNDLQDILTSLR